jgi:hypothetical protein
MEPPTCGICRLSFVICTARPLEDRDGASRRRGPSMRTCRVKALRSQTGLPSNMFAPSYLIGVQLGTALARRVDRVNAWLMYLIANTTILARHFYIHNALTQASSDLIAIQNNCCRAECAIGIFSSLGVSQVSDLCGKGSRGPATSSLAKTIQNCRSAHVAGCNCCERCKCYF